MREAIVIAQFERRLIELGCSMRRTREKVRELAEHHEDLKQALLEDGLTENEAESNATARIGNPIFLAEETVLLLRQSSWWGRHPIIGFCLLPPLCFAPVWLACCESFMGIALLLGRILPREYVFDDRAASALSDDPTLFNSTLAPLSSTLAVAAIVSIVLIFCWLARRSALGLKWTLAACGFCALTALFDNSGILPHMVFIGYWWHSRHWFFAVIPLLAAGGIYLCQRRMESRLAWVPMERSYESNGIIRKKIQLSFYRTPTCWVVAVLAAVILNNAVAWITARLLEKTRKAELRSRVWPAERAATVALLARQQSNAAAAKGDTVNLNGFLNATLTDSTDGLASGRTNTANVNNLAELPAGRHAFGGVLFDVEGKIQLAGKPLPADERKFPGHVNNIPIARRCARIHLLHGAGNVHAVGGKTARIVLHYEDGSRAELGIVAGRDVLDWWGPIYNTDAGDDRRVSSPDSQLAWVGANPEIRKESSDNSLRLYRSTFANPHPELTISSIDYISTLSGVGPFLVGLTTDPVP